MSSTSLSKSENIVLGASTALLMTNLRNAGVTDSDLDILNNHGVRTLEDYLHKPQAALATIDGITNEKAKTIAEEVHALVDLPATFETARALHAAPYKHFRITTGSKRLDELLDGGIESECITQLQGGCAAGKTMICHMLAVKCQLSVAEGGGDGKCIYVDADGTFNTALLVTIAQRSGMDQTQVLNNVMHVRPHNIEHQLWFLREARRLMSKSRFSLVIVDSCLSLFTSRFSAGAQVAARMEQLQGFLHKLQSLAIMYHVAVLATHRTYPRASAAPYDAEESMSMGLNIIKCASLTSIEVKKQSHMLHQAAVTESLCLPKAWVQFVILQNGMIGDPEDL